MNGASILVRCASAEACGEENHADSAALHAQSCRMLPECHGQRTANDRSPYAASITNASRCSLYSSPAKLPGPMIREGSGGSSGKPASRSQVAVTTQYLIFARAAKKIMPPLFICTFTTQQGGWSFFRLSTYISFLLDFPKCLKRS